MKGSKGPPWSVQAEMPAGVQGSGSPDLVSKGHEGSLVDGSREREGSLVGPKVKPWSRVQGPDGLLIWGFHRGA